MGGGRRWRLTWPRSTALPGITQGARTSLGSAVSPSEPHIHICKMGVITRRDFLRLKRDDVSETVTDTSQVLTMQQLVPLQSRSFPSSSLATFCCFPPMPAWF